MVYLSSHSFSDPKPVRYARIGLQTSASSIVELPRKPRATRRSASAWESAMRPEAVTRAQETQVSAPWKTWISEDGWKVLEGHNTQGVYIIIFINIICIYIYIYTYVILRHGRFTQKMTYTGKDLKGCFADTFDESYLYVQRSETSNSREGNVMVIKIKPTSIFEENHSNFGNRLQEARG